MNDKKIFGISAIFDKPDDIIKVAEKVAGSGYKEFDIYSPYPVHGMDRAMKLKPSKLGFITLVFGLSGAAFALLFMYWAMSLEYPMVIGGKPFFALPAFIPVTFEVTVLLATLSTVIGMLTFFFNFPFNSHPLHSTEFMKAVSLDKYGVCIEASDSKFDEVGVAEYLKGLGGSRVQTHYYPEKVYVSAFNPKFIGLLIVTFIVVSGGVYFALNKLMFMTPFDWMQYQPKYSVQAKNDFFPDLRTMRTPVESTIARGFMPYMNKGVTNPVDLPKNPMLPTKENLNLGEKKYMTFCSPCHGNYGDGDSRLGEHFPKPPSLHSTKIRDWEDGMVYHVIVNGQNVMPSYESQITRNERWAIVLYIRALQIAKNATEQDIEEAKKELSLNAK